MDKTIKINLAGTLFQIDEEAYRILRDYLQAISNRFRNFQSAHETIEDIEYRIAEIFQSQKSPAGIVSKENVESMISIIGKPEDFDVNMAEETSPFYSAPRRRMYRNPDDSIISGVCGGIGAYLDTDPVLFRILFVLFTAFFGIGFFVYLALWIALPPANTENQKRELFGDAYYSARKQYSQSQNTYSPGAPKYTSGYNQTSRISNAFNEVFRAIGRVCFIILRIFLIVIGIVLVLTGFLAILTLVMVLVFKLPGIFTSDGVNVHLSYYRDFLNYVVNPSNASWIIALTILAITLPLLAIIYAGLKLIFWFRAKDGIFSLAGFVLWVLIIAALAIILFNEGISFAEGGTSSVRNIIPNPPDTLYIVTGQKTADLKSNKEFLFPDADYSVLMVDSIHQLYMPARLKLNLAEDKEAKIEIQKRSSGRTRADAVRKAGSIIYNYRMSKDTLTLDEYFTLPAGSKWSAEYLKVNLFVPENTVLYFDKSAENLFHNGITIGKVKNDIITDTEYDYETDPSELGNKFWIISENGLKEAEKVSSKQK
jgi:phage shock protein PspC (stress-responsive transcriptional regulator)